ERRDDGNRRVHGQYLGSGVRSPQADRATPGGGRGHPGRTVMPSRESPTIPPARLRTESCIGGRSREATNLARRWSRALAGGPVWASPAGTSLAFVNLAARVVSCRTSRRASRCRQPTLLPRTRRS